MYQIKIALLYFAKIYQIKIPLLYFAKIEQIKTTLLYFAKIDQIRIPLLYYAKIYQIKIALLYYVKIDHIKFTLLCYVHLLLSKQNKIKRIIKSLIPHRWVGETFGKIFLPERLVQRSPCNHSKMTQFYLRLFGRSMEM